MVDSSELKKITQKIKDSTNVLVTVSSSPSVDELSAALAITLCMNKLNKHATAVFSGDVPPAIEFLNPDKTFENTVDSLRDFIIALDKEKADHLRYKVVDDMVKIFITPYRTTINENDLQFSQGDYNVELVLAIGVKNEKDLDRALESHGRILHDATVISFSIGDQTKLGGIEWIDNAASSYSEMLYQVIDGIKNDKTLIDEQIANAFLTGIVAATDRFSNNKTSSRAMTVAAELMAAGANQQLIATKLEADQTISTTRTNGNSSGSDTPPEDIPVESTKEESSDDGVAGALSISHMPEGTVDEVAKVVATEKSEEALSHVEQMIDKQTQQVSGNTQHDEAEAAEQKLAEQLTSAIGSGTTGIPLIPTPSPADRLSDTQVDPIVSNPWQTHSDQEVGEPMLGGTLNATTEQAEDDKRQQAEDDRNKTILSHSGSSYSANVPSFQSPINASAGNVDQEPAVVDILAEGNATSRTNHAELIQPPTPEPKLETIIQPPLPVAPQPTLADIDTQTRAAHDNARAAIDAALGGTFTQPEQQSSTASSDSLAGSLPLLPPLPPMPDFSTLPPLPGDMSSPSAMVSDELGATLPPAPVQQPASPSDPGQFRIPGQL